VERSDEGAVGAELDDSLQPFVPSAEHLNGGTSHAAFNQQCAPLQVFGARVNVTEVCCEYK